MLNFRWLVSSLLGMCYACRFRAMLLPQTRLFIPRDGAAYEGWIWICPRCHCGYEPFSWGRVWASFRRS